MNDRSGEFDRLRSECWLIIDFLDELGVLAHGDAFRAALDGAYEQRSLRGLRAAKADLNGRILQLSLDVRQVLAARLSEAGSEEDVDRTVDAIKARGSITTGDEYRLIEARVDAIHDDPAREEEVALLNRLLDAAHDRELAD